MCYTGPPACRDAESAAHANVHAHVQPSSEAEISSKHTNALQGHWHHDGLERLELKPDRNPRPVVLTALRFLAEGCTRKRQAP